MNNKILDFCVSTYNKQIKLASLIFFHKIKIIPQLFYRNPEGILIVRVDGVGDAVVFFHSLQTYRDIYPNEKFILVYNDQWQDFAKNIDLFDETIPINFQKFKTSILYRLKTVFFFSRRRFKIVLNPVYFRSFFGDDWLVRQINSVKKVAFQGNYSNTMSVLSRYANFDSVLCSKLHANANKIYTSIIPVDSQFKMVLLRDFEFCEKLAGFSIRPQLRPLPFPLPELDGTIKQPYVLINLGAGIESRMWNLDKMRQVINIIPVSYSIVFCGSSKERDYLYYILENNSSKNIIHDFVGKTSLLELCSLVKGCALLITNETSTSHIAVSVQCPSICIIGGGHFGLFQPYPEELFKNSTRDFRPRLAYKHMDCYSCNWICKHPLIDGRWKCINDIEVDEVKALVLEMLHLNDTQDK